MKKKTCYIIVGLIIVVGLVIDLVTKAIFANLLEYGDKTIEVIPNFFRFIYVENDGAAYGMLGGKTWVLILITIVFIIGFVAYYVFNHSTNMWFNISIGLIISGAIGNLVDRIFFEGIVRDFISIEIFNFIFNVADMWITFGVICFAVYIIGDMVREYKDKRKEKVDNDSEDK